MEWFQEIRMYKREAMAVFGLGFLIIDISSLSDTPRTRFPNSMNRKWSLA